MALRMLAVREVLKWSLILGLGCLVSWPTVAAGQDDPWEKIYGPKLTRARAFFETLQRDLSAGDRSAVCALVQYPLKQSFGIVASASACRMRYSDIFSRDVVQAVAASTFDDLISCCSGSLGVAPGTLWFTSLCLDKECTETAIRVITVTNSREMAEAAQPSKGRVLLACRTNGERLEVVADGARGVELRLWRTGRSRTTRPDVQVSQGITHVEGTGSCGHSVWEFATETRTYVVAESGCYPASSPLPRGTVGSFGYRLPDGSETSDHCIQ